MSQDSWQNTVNHAFLCKERWVEPIRQHRFSWCAGLNLHKVQEQEQEQEHSTPCINAEASDQIALSRQHTSTGPVEMESKWH